MEVSSTPYDQNSSWVNETAAWSSTLLVSLASDHVIFAAVVAKCADHLPLYRQSRRLINARFPDSVKEIREFPAACSHATFALGVKSARQLARQFGWSVFRSGESRRSSSGFWRIGSNTKSIASTGKLKNPNLLKGGSLIFPRS